MPCFIFGICSSFGFLHEYAVCEGGKTMASLLSVNPCFSGYLGLPRVVQVNLRMV